MGRPSTGGGGGEWGEAGGRGAGGGAPRAPPQKNARASRPPAPAVTGKTEKEGGRRFDLTPEPPPCPITSRDGSVRIRVRPCPRRSSSPGQTGRRETRNPPARS